MVFMHVILHVRAVGDAPYYGIVRMLARAVNDLYLVSKLYCTTEPQRYIP